MVVGSNPVAATSTSYHTERTDKKPFSGLIGQMTTSRVVAHQAGLRDVPLMFCNLTKSFNKIKHYNIFGFHLPEAIKTITMIHYC